MARLMLVCLLALCLAGLSLPRSPRVDNPGKPPVEMLIRQLGDDDFAVREAATRLLMERPEGGVRVRQADADKPFGKAGLRQGDIVLALDGVAVPSPEAFRRTLRTRLALGQPMAFRVRRGAEVVDLRVPVEQ